MKHKALAVFLAVAVLPTIALAAKPVPVPTLTPLAWYDVNGKLVGRSTTPPSNPASPWLVLAWADDFVPLQLEVPLADTGGVEFAPQGAVHYSLPNCTGTAYLNEGARPLVGYRRGAAIAAMPDGMILYVTAPNAPIVERVIQSSKYSDPCVNTNGPVTTTVFDVEGSMNLTGLFAAPFYIK